jgi:Cu(I)/Ag(I) efflux system membrane fusion protein
MNDSEPRGVPPVNEVPVAIDAAQTPPTSAPTPVAAQPATRAENRRWWFKLLLAPALFLAAGVMLIVVLGVMQRMGFISADGGDGHIHAAGDDAHQRWICPMMCTPPLSEPGRCPVCGMELVPASSGLGTGGAQFIQFDPVARRVAHIQTATVASMPLQRTIRAIGELRYDEGTLKSISAYVDGRLDRLYANYTGIVVSKGDNLALVYSPRLYSGQVELLLAKKARTASQTSTLTRVAQSNDDLYESAKERLILLGMTEEQIEHLEATGEASSRMHLSAPMSGTVIEKLATEGQYVKEGDAIYKLADLSTVWLMLRLFPEDAALIRYGQKVEAEVQSLPGRSFAGRVAFVDPSVNPQTRTVGVRVVIPNPDGELRVGDYANAKITVPINSSPGAKVYDAELANKWISPRHPQIVASSPGACPICEVDLVPASEFGFAAEPTASTEALVVPRNAVLMAGKNSVAYVETAPGHFEIRQVVLGSTVGEQIVIRQGLKAGEHVATRGNFLIDSQMQLAGNPSLIDPTRGQPQRVDADSPEMLAALVKLSAADVALVKAQGTCPVTGLQLGSMGAPPKLEVQGAPVFICCEGCRESVLADPDKYLEKMTQKHDHAAPPSKLDLPPIGRPQLIESAEANSTTNQEGAR